MIRVFLASSSKYSPINGYNDSTAATNLDRIIKGIKSHISSHPNLRDKVEIVPWWECINFKTAGEVLESLIDIVQEYDMGIFVLGEDVKGKEKNKTGYFPNSNVLIELGMFKMMGKKTFILQDENVITPSDINNTKSVKFKDRKIADGFIETIREIERDNYSQKPYGDISVHYDYELSEKFIEFNRKDNSDLCKWDSKALFVGSKSAYLWKEIETSSQYVETTVIEDFVEYSLAKPFFNKIDNIISFGPGIGLIDEKLIDALPSKCCYIPIDLNISLAIQSANTIRNTGRSVPFAIIDDFEISKCYPRLSRLIEENKNKIGRNNLFSMLGVTFSNLSMNCQTFFHKMNDLLKDKDDLLLLDVIIYDEKSDDELQRIIQSQITTDYKDLICNSIARKRLCKKPNLQTLQSGISFLEKNSNQYKKYTKIEETKVATIKYKDNTILVAKYYQFDKFQKYIEEKTSFKIVASKPYKDDLRGVFLIAKKEKEKKD